MNISKSMPDLLLSPIGMDCWGPEYTNSPTAHLKSQHYIENGSEATVERIRSAYYGALAANALTIISGYGLPLSEYRRQDRGLLRLVIDTRNIVPRKDENFDRISRCTAEQEIGKAVLYAGVPAKTVLVTDSMVQTLTRGVYYGTRPIGDTISVLPGDKIMKSHDDDHKLPTIYTVPTNLNVGTDYTRCEVEGDAWAVNQFRIIGAAVIAPSFE